MQEELFQHLQQATQGLIYLKKKKSSKWSNIVANVLNRSVHNNISNSQTWNKANALQLRRQIVNILLEINVCVRVVASMCVWMPVHYVDAPYLQMSEHSMRSPWT